LSEVWLLNFLRSEWFQKFQWPTSISYQEMMGIFRTSRGWAAILSSPRSKRRAISPGRLGLATNSADLHPELAYSWCIAMTRQYHAISIYGCGTRSWLRTLYLVRFPLWLYI
jgi:hypothetical protein